LAASAGSLFDFFGFLLFRPLDSPLAAACRQGGYEFVIGVSAEIIDVGSLNDIF
jgi:hypothetical protein